MKIIVNNDVLISNGDNTKPNDNFMIEQTEYSVGLSGIVLNAGQITVKDIIDNIVDGKIQRVYKGSYVTWYYDKINGKIYVANDLLSKQSVYCYVKDGLILVNTSLFDLCSDIRTNGKQPDINLNAVNYFCENNAFHGDITYEKNTIFLPAYSYLVIDCKNKTVQTNKLLIPKMIVENDINEKEIIDTLEKLFLDGLYLQWNKNKIYQRDQIMTLSGRMDSRALILHLLGEEDLKKIYTYTYAQSGSDDARISKKFAERLHINNVFIPLDNCEFAYLRDEIVEANEGQMYYLGATGAILMAKMCKEKNNPGIIHTGVGGGELFGDICLKDGDKYDSLEADITINQQRNFDDIRRCLNFQKTTSKYFSVFSPFLYEDFFEFVMTLPASIKRKRKLYVKWYRRYMNSDFPSAKTYSFFAKLFNYGSIKFYSITGKRNPANMNPLQYWYDTNDKLKKYIDDVWKQDMEVLSDQKKVVGLLDEKFKQSVVKKLAVITASKTLIRILGR